MGVQEQITSSLSDLIRLVSDIFAAVGDGTTFLIGKQYLEQFGAGTPPRILWVPEPDSRQRPAQKLNADYVASLSHSCTVYVRGAEDGTDAGRFDSAYAIGDLVVNALKLAAPGLVELGDYRETSPLPVDAYGAEVALTFTYTRWIARNPKVWSLHIAKNAPLDPDRPGPPGSSNGKTYTVTTASAATRP